VGSYATSEQELTDTLIDALKAAVRQDRILW
jgi:hypothetical protein